MFTSIRIGGGVTVILLENDPSSTGLIVATIILLGVGIIPLMLVTIGLLRIVLAEDFEDKRIFHIITYAIRTLFFVGIVLIIAGGSLGGKYKDPSDVSIGLKLVKAGYILLAVILAILIAFQSYLWGHKRGLSGTSLTILKGTSAAIPFLIVRIAYAFLSVFDTNPKWNDLSGSIAAFFCMALLMELFVVAIYITVGLSIPQIRYNKREWEDARRRRFGRVEAGAGSAVEADRVEDHQPERGGIMGVKDKALKAWKERD